MNDQKEITSSYEDGITIFQLKRLIKKLEEYKGIGTSLFSLNIPSKRSITDINKMLLDDYGKATNIKDRQNRQLVQEAIISAQQRLKRYQRIPNNGLAIFIGAIVDATGKGEKKVLIDFEPPKPLSTFNYEFKGQFNVQLLRDLLDDDLPFGFIIVDGHGSLYAKLMGEAKEIITKFQEDLPKKHNKGGQSSVRFARLRLEKRQNYMRKVCEVAVQCFITDDKINVKGLILAGSADFKNVLSTTDLLDPRLKCKILKIVDVSYGGENGLNQAIELSEECLLNVKFVQEKNIVSQFFDQIAKDSGLIVYGLQETMKVFETGALDTLIIYEWMTQMRLVLRNKITQTTKIVYIAQEDVNSPKYLMDGEAEMEKIECEPLIEWLAENQQKINIKMEFITGNTPEGNQFIKGFTGIGGFLRYKIDVEMLISAHEENEWVCDDPEFI